MTLAKKPEDEKNPHNRRDQSTQFNSHIFYHPNHFEN